MMWKELVRVCSGGGGHRTTQASLSEADSGPSTVNGDGDADLAEADDAPNANDDDDDVVGDDDSMHTAAAIKSVPSRSMISLSF